MLQHHITPFLTSRAPKDECPAVYSMLYGWKTMVVRCTIHCIQSMTWGWIKSRWGWWDRCLVPHSVRQARAELRRGVRIVPIYKGFWWLKNRLTWCGHVQWKDNVDWVKGCTKLVSPDLSLGISQGMLRTMAVGEASGRDEPSTNPGNIVIKRWWWSPNKSLHM